MRDEQARTALDTFVAAVEEARRQREQPVPYRLNTLLDGCRSLAFALEFLLLRHREMADERERAVLGFADWLRAGGIVTARPREEGDGYARVNLAELVADYLREMD